MYIPSLSIGDWLQDWESKLPMMIEAIYLNDNTYTIDSKRYRGVKVFNLEPIPLTEDILKANGFEEVGEYYIHRVDNNPNHYDFKLKIGGAIQREGFSLQCGIYIITIKYVHQLQHILRDCGLGELADNFKIKED